MERTSSWLFRLMLLLPILAGCELEPRRSVQQAQEALRLPASEQPLLHLMGQAHQALADRDFERCADRYAAAARVSRESRSASCWYRASQCAARAGDYITSRFHIEAAASAGLANLERLRGDPLLRPLHGGARWNLINDAVRANQLEDSGREPVLALCEAASEPVRQARLAPSPPRPMLDSALGR